MSFVKIYSGFGEKIVILRPEEIHIFGRHRKPSFRK
jgi:hypothetical protein